MRALASWHVCALVVGVAVLGGVSGGALAQSTETNGTVTEAVQHERPDSVGESGDLERLQRWLDGRLGEQLESSTVALREGEYERARAMLGEEYDEDLAQYVDVAGETGEGETAGETYRNVRDSQRDLASRAQQFAEANERYERARENGNATAARAAAREMNRLGGRIRESGSNATRGYERLANQTGADTSEERTVVTNFTRDVTERREEVRLATFAETDLAVLDATRTVSFADPLELTGRVTMANGTALADRTVTIAVADRPRTVTTDGDGRFTLSYRPRTLRLNATSVRVAYVPRNDSVYLGSNASVPVDVEQVEPTVQVSERTGEARFGQSAGATVTVTVDGEPVDGVPVVADVDGYRLGRATTNGAGSARVASALPATVPAGDRELRAAVPLRNRAVGPAAERAPLTVDSTETALTVTGDHGGDEATVTGRLVTVDGRPVAGRQIRVARNGTALTTVETGPDGAYSATVPLPIAGTGSGDRVRIQVAFDGGGTSLESARATQLFALQSRPEQTETGAVQRLLSMVDPWTTTAGVTLLAVVVGSGLAWRRRSSVSDAADSGPSGASATATPDVSTGTDAGVDAGPDHPPPIERAEAFLERGAAGAAVRAAYAAIRERYGRERDPGTHSELFEAVQSLDDDERQAVERVTRAYEREAFAPGTVDESGARVTVDAARELVDRRR